MKRLLILYSKVNSGHHKAAEAIAQSVKANYPQTEVKVVDAGDFILPWVWRICEAFYLFMVRKIPWLWDYLYDKNTLKKRFQFARQLHILLDRSTLLSFIKEFKPQAIVCTQAVPCEMVATLKYRHNLKVPLIAVPTDFYVHTYWIPGMAGNQHFAPLVNAYMVATEECKKHLIEKGIASKQIMVTGIPIRPIFSQPLPKIASRKKLGLPLDKKIILVLGGGRGLIPFHKILKSLFPLKDQLHIVSVLGTNRVNFFRIRNQERKLADCLTLMGYVENINELMAAADIVIGKPGGITSSEILCNGLPFIITDPLPGQEKYNTKFLVKSEAALWAPKTAAVGPMVKNLIDNPSLYEKISQQAYKLSKPQAAFDIVKNLAALTYKKK